jgi:multimeric flavodoxin WrbA/nitrite reductase/ring-hydroxylating ferredoxin subunit
MTATPENTNDWFNAGPVESFADKPLTEITIGKLRLAVSQVNGVFGAISNVCNHAGGPLGQGRLAGDYVVCPWHNWTFHRLHGRGEPGFEDDAVPSHAVKVENGCLWINPVPATARCKKPHAPHSLARPVKRAPGPIRVVGISTTAQDPANPRYSTSEALLEVALKHIQQQGQCETQLIKLAELKFRACEGYYSKSAHACTWPCSITQMDDTDQMTPVYEALVHWADVVLLATPIRWGQASSLYFRMAERLNCVQNQITINDRVLIQNKVAGFIITGGQDNIQGVAGQLLGFFTELGFHVPQFPFIAHSRGWTAEDMEHNIAAVQHSAELREGACALADRAVNLARKLQADEPTGKTERGGRKAHQLEVEKTTMP